MRCSYASENVAPTTSFAGPLLSLAMLLFGNYGTTTAQPLPKIPQIQPFGIDGFRLMLQQRGLQATPDRVGTALNDKPEETVAVVLGDLKTVTQGGGLNTDGRGIQLQLESFVTRGGRLLVASDIRGQRLRSASICGIWVRETTRWLRDGYETRRYAYQEAYQDCPIVSQFNRSAEPQLFDGVTELVSNRPSSLIGVDGTSIVAWLPFKVSRTSKEQLPLMAVCQRGKGKVLFIADHSFFVNEMLVHGDNARFANNVTKWLCDSEKRQRLVLISDGHVLPNWTFGASPPSIPLSSLLRAAQYGALSNLPLGDSMLPFLNEAIARSQQENEFNTAARRAAFSLAGGRGVRFGVLLMTMILAIGFLGWILMYAFRATTANLLSASGFEETSPARAKSLTAS